MSPAHKKLEKADVDMCRAFQKIVNQGCFEVKGDALYKAGMIFKWISDLDKRIEETIKPPPAPPVMRQLTEEELTAGREELKQLRKGKK